MVFVLSVFFFVSFSVPSLFLLLFSSSSFLPPPAHPFRRMLLASLFFFSTFFYYVERPLHPSLRSVTTCSVPPHVFLLLRFHNKLFFSSFSLPNSVPQPPARSAHALALLFVFPLAPRLSFPASLVVRVLHPHPLSLGSGPTPTTTLLISRASGGWRE
ncbi:hypothetical protein DFJ73DRAFT_869821 [Zopfochytrium polystomum]|nr:hypothetical protein DFJ73DRAFT_869821 [Zopfochytrium polystomum]